MFKLNENEDLIYYHNKILSYIKQEKAKIPTYEQQCQKIALQCYYSFSLYGILDEDKQFIMNQIKNKDKILNKQLSYKEFKDNVKEIKKINGHIAFIQYQDSFYQINITYIIEQYKKIIQIPIKNSFMCKKRSDKNDELLDLIEQFTYTIKQMFPEPILNEIFKDLIEEYKKKKKNDNIFNENITITYCKLCNEPLSENICSDCGYVESELIITEPTSTYDDSTRINVHKEFTYLKRCHFRDTINQFQGKQNKYIPQKVYDDLYAFIDKEGLCDKTKSDTIEKYRKLKKSHIREFLKATNHSNHYEDIQLIYSKITGKDCPCISQYEKQLYEDFDALVDAFCVLLNEPGTIITRDNFLNSHYVLRQLLLKQKVKVPHEDLNYLKTPTRLREHDEIYQKCCCILNWNFIPMT